MFDSTGSIELVASYLEALGVASGARARRRALQVVNDIRATSGSDEVTPPRVLRLVRERALLAEGLSGTPLPVEHPTRMPTQAFRYGMLGRRDEAPFRGWERGDGEPVEAGGR